MQKGGNVGINNTAPAYSLDVTGTDHFTGNVTVGGDLTVDGTIYGNLTLANSETADGILTVDGTSTLTGAVSSGALNVNGNTTINGQLGIYNASANPLFFNNESGWVNINPTSYPSTGCMLNIPAIANGGTDTIATLASTQTFTGANTFSGNVDISGTNTLTVGGMTSMTGNVTLSNNLAVGGSLTVDGAIESSITQTPYGGSGWTLYVWEPFQGSKYKKCIAFFDAYYNTTASYFNFPASFTTIANLTANTTNPSVVPVSNTLIKVNLPSTSTASTGL